MNNPFKKQFRIIESIDSNSVSTFYPERTIFGIWCRYDSEYGSLSFNSYRETNKWLCYKYVAKTKTHQVDEIFNELTKK